jgi:uncharacterized protein with HEPN domain
MRVRILDMAGIRNSPFRGYGQFNVDYTVIHIITQAAVRQAKKEAEAISLGL